MGTEIVIQLSSVNMLWLRTMIWGCRNCIPRTPLGVSCQHGHRSVSISQYGVPVRGVSLLLALCDVATMLYPMNLSKQPRDLFLHNSINYVLVHCALFTTDEHI